MQSRPATGISIGVSRLLNALRGRKTSALPPLVVVLALDKEDRAGSFALASELRGAGIRAEAYVGDGGMKAQLKYADRRGAAIAVIEGGDERARGEVTLKDLALGAELSKSTENRAAWVKDRPAQQSVKRDQLLSALFTWTRMRSVLYAAKSTVRLTRLLPVTLARVTQVEPSQPCTVKSTTPKPVKVRLSVGSTGLA